MGSRGGGSPQQKQDVRASVPDFILHGKLRDHGNSSDIYGEGSKALMLDKRMTFFD